jgi:hypothetical protein
MIARGRGREHSTSTIDSCSTAYAGNPMTLSNAASISLLLDSRGRNECNVCVGCVWLWLDKLAVVTRALLDNRARHTVLLRASSITDIAQRQSNAVTRGSSVGKVQHNQHTIGKNVNGRRAGSTIASKQIDAIDGLKRSRRHSYRRAVQLRLAMVALVAALPNAIVGRTVGALDVVHCARQRGISWVRAEHERQSMRGRA